MIPAFNAASTLGETLDSLTGQSYRDWEALVVDDGSSDSTQMVAAQYAKADPRIRVLSQANTGTAGAYNAGVSLAVGEFIVILSADDALLPSHLTTLARFMDVEPGYDIYSSNGYYWLEEGQRVLVYDSPPWLSPRSLTLEDVIRVCFYGVGSAYRREWFTRVGGYRVGVFGEDYDFWLRSMASGARHRYLPQPLSLHRVSGSQKSARRVSAYRSDIALVTALAQTHQLTPDELNAVSETVQDRRRAIALARLDTGRRICRSVLARALGEQNTRALLARIRRSKRRRSSQP